MSRARSGSPEGSPPATTRTRGPRQRVGFSLPVSVVADLAQETGATEATVRSRLEKALETVAIECVRADLEAEHHQAELDEIAAMEAALEAKRAALREKDAAHQQNA